MHNYSCRGWNRFRRRHKTVVFGASLGLAGFQRCNAHFPPSRYPKDLGRLRMPFGGETEELYHPIQPLRAFTRNFRTRGQHITDSRKTSAAFVLILRQEFGDSGKTRFGLEQQHEELLANKRLELCKRKA